MGGPTTRLGEEERAARAGERLWLETNSGKEGGVAGTWEGNLSHFSSSSSRTMGQWRLPSELRELLRFLRRTGIVEAVGGW